MGRAWFGRTVFYFKYFWNELRESSVCPRIKNYLVCSFWAVGDWHCCFVDSSFYCCSCAQWCGWVVNLVLMWEGWHLLTAYYQVGQEGHVFILLCASLWCWLYWGGMLWLHRCPCIWHLERRPVLYKDYYYYYTRRGKMCLQLVNWRLPWIEHDPD